MKVVIRPADKRDVPALSRLGAMLVRTHYAFDADRFMAPGPDLERGYAWFLGTQLREHDVIIYVAEQAGNVAARRGGMRDGRREGKIVAYGAGEPLARACRALRHPPEPVAGGHGNPLRVPMSIVGYVYAGIEPRSWKELRERAGFVHDVVVDPRARRQGLAARLVDAAATALEARGVPRVILWTAEKNTRARRLFQRLGFRETMIEMTRESPDPDARRGGRRRTRRQR